MRFDYEWKTNIDRSRHTFAPVSKFPIPRKLLPPRVVPSHAAKEPSFSIYKYIEFPQIF